MCWWGAAIDELEMVTVLWATRLVWVARGGAITLAVAWTATRSFCSVRGREVCTFSFFLVQMHSREAQWASAETGFLHPHLQEGIRAVLDMHSRPLEELSRAPESER